MIGTTVGPYRVLNKVGEGGMGEVYRAVDSRLGRNVALKVISRTIIADSSSIRRFETEARAASALNHPAIVTIYDVGQNGGVSWIAIIAAAPDAATVLPVDQLAKNRTILQAIDKAVAERDQHLKRTPERAL